MWGAKRLNIKKYLSLGMKMISILAVLFFSLSACAQMQSLDVNGAAMGGYGTVRFNDFSAIGQKKGNVVDYSEVRGRCFWDNEWNPGVLVLKGGNAIKLKNIKLNLYTNEVHYLNIQGTELVAQPGQVKKIVLFSATDTMRTIGIFESFFSKEKNKEDGYFQLLADGKIQFLKKTTVHLNKQKYDPMLGKVEFKFVPDTQFFLRKDNALNPIKKLNKSSLLSVVGSNSESEKWLTSNQNKLKSEEEVVQFLAFLNQSVK
jgi:hypothetical protein